LHPLFMTSSTAPQQPPAPLLDETHEVGGTPSGPEQAHFTATTVRSLSRCSLGQELDFHESDAVRLHDLGGVLDAPQRRRLPTRSPGVVSSNSMRRRPRRRLVDTRPTTSMPIRRTPAERTPRHPRCSYFNLTISGPTACSRQKSRGRPAIGGRDEAPPRRSRCHDLRGTSQPRVHLSQGEIDLVRPCPCCCWRSH
jgi:hypothetical protein